MDGTKHGCTLYGEDRREGRSLFSLDDDTHTKKGDVSKHTQHGRESAVVGSVGMDSDDSRRTFRAPFNAPASRKGATPFRGISPPTAVMTNAPLPAMD